MPRVCAVGGCGGITDANTSLHFFPANVKENKKWNKFVASTRKDWKGSAAFSRQVICSNHFTEDCVFNDMKWKLGFKKKNTLKPGAIPTIKYPKKRPRDNYDEEFARFMKTTKLSRTTGESEQKTNDTNKVEIKTKRENDCEIEPTNTETIQGPGPAQHSEGTQCWEPNQGCSDDNSYTNIIPKSEPEMSDNEAEDSKIGIVYIEPTQDFEPTQGSSTDNGYLNIIPNSEPEMSDDEAGDCEIGIICTEPTQVLEPNQDLEQTLGPSNSNSYADTISEFNLIKKGVRSRSKSTQTHEIKKKTKSTQVGIHYYTKKIQCTAEDIVKATGYEPPT